LLGYDIAEDSNGLLDYRQRLAARLDTASNEWLFMIIP
jgi:hypothetical protein